MGQAFCNAATHDGGGSDDDAIYRHASDWKGV